ncbi:hypothetical protein GCM10009800_20880 [Nocardiopsis rhodophaea]
MHRQKCAAAGLRALSDYPIGIITALEKTHPAPVNITYLNDEIRGTRVSRQPREPTVEKVHGRVDGTSRWERADILADHERGP